MWRCARRSDGPTAVMIGGEPVQSGDHGRFASASSFFQVFFELGVHPEAILLGVLDRLRGFVKTSTLHVDHGQIVVRLAELGIDVNCGLPLDLGLIAAAVTKVSAAE